VYNLAWPEVDPLRRMKLSPTTGEKHPYEITQKGVQEADSFFR
jgi:hypothetical protein